MHKSTFFFLKSTLSRKQQPCARSMTTVLLAISENFSSSHFREYPISSNIIPPVNAFPRPQATSLQLGHVVSRLQRIVVREELVRIVSILQRIQPRQLPLRVPPQRALVAVPVVDVDLDVGGAGATGGDKESARSAPDVGGGGGEVAGFLETDVEETRVG